MNHDGCMKLVPLSYTSIHAHENDETLQRSHFPRFPPRILPLRPIMRTNGKPQQLHQPNTITERAINLLRFEGFRDTHTHVLSRVSSLLQVHAMHVRSTVGLVSIDSHSRLTFHVVVVSVCVSHVSHKLFTTTVDNA